MRFLDVGCGVGNSFYPLVEKKPGIQVFAFDLSQKAVDLAKKHQNFNEKQIKLFQLDISTQDIPTDCHKVDYALLMFVLSAIVPEKHEEILQKVHNALTPGGILYFRDYSRYDMAQIRFSKRKKNKIDENLYMRHDKTLAYYFKKEEIEDLLRKVGFEVLESKVICRLIVNRKDDKRMHRLWLQVKLKKK